MNYFHAAIRQLKQVIYNFAVASFDIDHTKALTALKTLRDECVKLHISEYNDWLRELKNVVLKDRKTLLWTSIVNNQLGLITINENRASDISEQEAILFLQISETEDEEIQDMDADGLFD